MEVELVEEIPYEMCPNLWVIFQIYVLTALLKFWRENTCCLGYWNEVLICKAKASCMNIDSVSFQPTHTVVFRIANLAVGRIWVFNTLALEMKGCK